MRVDQLETQEMLQGFFQQAMIGCPPIEPVLASITRLLHEFGKFLRVCRDVEIAYLNSVSPQFMLNGVQRLRFDGNALPADLFEFHRRLHS